MTEEEQNIRENASFISTSDFDFINTTITKMATDIEDNSVQKRDYQTLISSILLIKYSKI